MTENPAFLRLVAELPPPSTWPAERTEHTDAPGDRSPVAFTLPPESARNLEAAAQALKTPVLALLAAGLQALLYRVASPWENADVEEVVVGAATGAHHLEAWLPLRQPIDPALSFSALAKRNAAELRALHPLDGSTVELAKEAGVAPDAICRALVLLDPEADEAGVVGFEPDLAFAFTTGDEYQGTLTYRGELYSRQTAERIVACYLRLIHAAVQTPRTPVGLLPLAASAPTPPTPDPPADRETPSAHVLFDRTAAHHPDVPALRWDGGELSYAELATAAEEWCTRLGEARVVALSGPRTPQLVVALLAILKHGAGYVPLDPAYPQERLDYMLADSGADVLVCPTGYAEVFEIPDGVRLVGLDTVFTKPGPETTASTAKSAPTHAVDGEDLCYVIYTSGSTGYPKGVEMPHRPLASLLDWQARHSEAGIGWNTLQFAALSFDVAFQEIFATWSTGGTLVLIADEVRRDPDRLIAYLDEHRVHRLFGPFVALQQLAETAVRSGRFPHHLREVVTAGEQLQVSPAVREFFWRTGARLENQYGPTETHVVTAERLPADPAVWPELPVIGAPIDRTQIEILDERLQPLPVGVPGEICVSGVSLAHGYVGRPELTAERFARRERAGEKGAHGADRVYRTGDYGTLLPDGRIQYLGRRDGQVKIRGFRVELGEVESRIKAQEGLAEAIVIAQDTPTHGKRLIAYYMLAAGHDVPPWILRTLLAQQLPGHIVPFACVAVTNLPLTPSGKADRRTLASWPLPEDPAAAYEEVRAELGIVAAAGVVGGCGKSGPGSDEDKTAPDSPFEQVLAELWAEALECSRVGVHADLFDLGVESRIALAVSVRLSQVFRIPIPVRVLFDRPSVAEQASWLAEQDGYAAHSLAEIARISCSP
ncbi:amino acid adenylation domain-containing protein [Nonomuraea sp. NPDC049152]|uniref:non-ribosomal peptide synthetase n=1 Tax=Nonomuraea sp. NPDC049152 TaxID=3154350 RepID=UPI0033DC4B37